MLRKQPRGALPRLEGLHLLALPAEECGPFRLMGFLDRIGRLLAAGIAEAIDFRLALGVGAFEAFPLPAVAVVHGPAARGECCVFLLLLNRTRFTIRA